MSSKNVRRIVNISVVFEKKGLNQKEVKMIQALCEILTIKKMKADHSSRTVSGIKCLRPIKHWDRGFQSTRVTDVCPHLFCVYIALSR
jgi:hypothetical protein